MTRDEVNQLCAAYPGAEVSDPWGGGHDAWKVGGKMFACMGTANEGLVVKCPDIETAELLIEAGGARKAAYFHRSWVMLPFDALSQQDAAHRLDISYTLIRSKLPKKVQAALE